VKQIKKYMKIQEVLEANKMMHSMKEQREEDSPLVMAKRVHSPENVLI
jgi:hypothetical protein